MPLAVPSPYWTTATRHGTGGGGARTPLDGEVVIIIIPLSPLPLKRGSDLSVDPCSPPRKGARGPRRIRVRLSVVVTAAAAAAAVGVHVNRCVWRQGNGLDDEPQAHISKQRPKTLRVKAIEHSVYEHPPTANLPLPSECKGQKRFSICGHSEPTALISLQVRAHWGGGVYFAAHGLAEADP